MRGGANELTHLFPLPGEVPRAAARGDGGDTAVAPSDDAYGVATSPTALSPRGGGGSNPGSRAVVGVCDMISRPPIPDVRVTTVTVDDDRLSVELMDGRAISVPLTWYPRLADATPAQRARWEVAGGGYGIHWPEIDEDLSTESLLRGAPARAAG